MELLYFLVNFLLIVSIGNYLKVENIFTILLLIIIVNIITGYLLEKDKDKLVILIVLPIILLFSLIHLPLFEEFWNCLTSSNKSIKLFSYSLMNILIFSFIYNVVKKNKNNENFFINVLQYFVKK